MKNKFAPPAHGRALSDRTEVLNLSQQHGRRWLRHSVSALNDGLVRPVMHFMPQFKRSIMKNVK